MHNHPNFRWSTMASPSQLLSNSIAILVCIMISKSKLGITIKMFAVPHLSKMNWMQMMDQPYQCSHFQQNHQHQTKLCLQPKMNQFCFLKMNHQNIVWMVWQIWMEKALIQQTKRTPPQCICNDLKKKTKKTYNTKNYNKAFKFQYNSRTTFCRGQLREMWVWNL